MEGYFRTGGSDREMCSAGTIARASLLALFLCSLTNMWFCWSFCKVLSGTNKYVIVVNIFLKHIIQFIARKRATIVTIQKKSRCHLS